MIDPTLPPFSLDAEAVAWVHATLADLTLEQKVGQLFTLVVMNPDPEVNLATIREAGIEPGGFMARPFAKTDVQDLHRALQDASRVPLLLAANLERGGDGLTVEGTTVGTQYGVAATDDETHAYRLGLVAGREGAAVGCTWAFAPVIDLDLNPANPITNTRTYGSRPRARAADGQGLHARGSTRPGSRCRSSTGPATAWTVATSTSRPRSTRSRSSSGRPGSARSTAA